MNFCVAYLTLDMRISFLIFLFMLQQNMYTEGDTTLCQRLKEFRFIFHYKWVHKLNIIQSLMKTLFLYREYIGFHLRLELQKEFCNKNA